MKPGWWKTKLCALLQEHQLCTASYSMPSRWSWCMLPQACAHSHPQHLWLETQAIPLLGMPPGSWRNIELPHWRQCLCSYLQHLRWTKLVWPQTSRGHQPAELIKQTMSPKPMLMRWSCNLHTCMITLKYWAKANPEMLSRKRFSDRWFTRMKGEIVKCIPILSQPNFFCKDDCNM